ncbi:hypothetical protein DSM112329_00614 [Paraconexibacter sp. AEG42_29]|uniref:Saccharopine dehydrogenase NADP binding domain-containing protein n=1 Tax=Paraconexibacter sp. AEG42_29 TaxID=2997339 RepID=A0AAU7AQ34_9ACTN
MTAPSTRPIAVYGATGYTGDLVVAELRRRGLDVVLSGRRPDALAAVAAKHGLDPGAAVRAAAADDLPALTAAFAGCGAVIACAGPFGQHGHGVVQAAVAAGAHYVDTTGEQPFIKAVVKQYGPGARNAGVALVSGMGFDYLPGDLLCNVTAAGAGPLSDLTIAYAIQGFGATRGTAKSALLMLASGEDVYTDGALRPAPVRQPLGRTFDYGPGLGVKTVARYPAGEVITVPRHVDTAQVTSLITAATFAPHPLMESVVPITTPAIGLLLKTPLRSLLAKGIDRLPAGPAEDARRAVAYTLVCEATPADGGPVRRGVLHGSDIYGITAVTTAHAAELMTAAGYDKAGGLAPAEAYDAASFLDALAPHGISYSIAVR